MDGIQVGSPVQRFLSSPAGPKLNIHSIPLRLHSPTFYGQKEEEEEEEEEEEAIKEFITGDTEKEIRYQLLLIE